MEFQQFVALATYAAPDGRSASVCATTPSDGRCIIRIIEDNAVAEERQIDPEDDHLAAFASACQDLVAQGASGVAGDRAIPPTTETRMKVHEKTRDEERIEQRAILDDPLQFAHEAWDALIGSGPFDVLLCDDLPRLEWDNKDEALHIAELAAQTPGTGLRRYVGEASDAANDLATTMEGKGMHMGAVLEQLRQGLLRVLESVHQPHPTAQLRAQTLGAMRAELVARAGNRTIEGGEKPRSRRSAPLATISGPGHHARGRWRHYTAEEG
jgi:hypothetical protein